MSQERRRYGRVEVDRPITVVFIERRQLQRRDLRMVNVGLGGCLVQGELPADERVAVLAHRGLFIVGRVMSGGDPGTTRVEWAPEGADADELIVHFGLPES